MHNIPISLVVFMTPIIVTLVVYGAIHAWRAIVALVKKKLGLDLPDNLTVEADIEAAVRALLPILIHDAVTSNFDLDEIVKAVEDAIAKANPQADLAPIAEIVRSAVAK